MDEFQELAIKVKEELKRVRTKLDRRQEIVKLYGFNNKDRIVLDVQIKEKIDMVGTDCDRMDHYMESKAKKFSPDDLSERAKTV